MLSLDGDIKTFLDRALDPAEPDDPDFPFVTLTYAQSLDARIAGRGGKQLRLSGQDSMRMTHQCVVCPPLSSGVALTLGEQACGSCTMPLSSGLGPSFMTTPASPVRALSKPARAMS